jgi:hypothetical protein
MKCSLILFFSLFLGIELQAQVKTFKIDSSKFNKPVMIILDSLLQKDQGIRYEFQSAIQEKAGPARMDSLLTIMHQQDKENLAIVKSLIAKHGWLGPQKVGINASQALFLVIQHADLATQEQYLPLIRAAEKKGQILSSNLALLEDRINMRKGLKQVYGSQGFPDKQTGRMYIYPVVDPDHLDKRRASVGLEPMAEYAKALGMDWNLEDYKNMLPEIEKLAEMNKF